MIETMTSIFALMLLFILMNHSYHIRKRKYNIRNRVEIKIEQKDINYIIKPMIYVNLSIVLGVIQYKQQGNYLGYLIALALFSLGILSYLESKQPLVIYDSGVCFPEKYIVWNEIVKWEWDKTNRKNYEKIILTAKRQYPIFLFTEYELKMVLPVSQKEIINKILKAKVKSIV